MSALDAQWPEGYAHRPDDNMENLAVSLQDHAAGRPDSVLGAVWRILDDTRHSYRLAMESEGVDPGKVDAVQDTVLDYLTNHYGDW